jgi:hypothetical protein
MRLSSIGGATVASVEPEGPQRFRYERTRPQMHPTSRTPTIRFDGTMMSHGRSRRSWEPFSRIQPIGEQPHSPNSLPVSDGSGYRHDEGIFMPARDPQHLSPNHRDTLLQIFQHPTSHNIDWRAVLSLLEAVGEVEERKGGTVQVTLGDESELLVPPKHKDVDVEQVVDLRRMLTSAGYADVVKGMEDKGKEV